MNDKLDYPDEPPPAVAASTLVLFRDRPGSAPDLLVVERSTKMAFAGGAIVFPGGKTDADDHAIAANPALARGAAMESDEAAARVGAIRETLEESGIIFGFAEHPDADWIHMARAALNAREPFSALIATAGLSLDLDQLVPFARWRPKHREARVFDTRFYIGGAAADTPDPVVDETENVSSFWASAPALIEAAGAGKVSVIYPTMRNLERLALFADYAAAEAHARAIPVQMISPFSEERDGELHLCIPEGLGYPITSEALSRASTAYSKATLR